MKKMHDELIRNIYKLSTSSDHNPEVLLNQIYVETLKSRALPASYYSTFTNIRMITDLVYNGQQNTVEDIKILLKAMLAKLVARTYKQHNMPIDFYYKLGNYLTDVIYELEANGIIEAHRSLREAVEDLITKYGPRMQRAKLTSYQESWPAPKNKLGSSWYDHEELDPAYIDYWRTFHQFQRSVNFRGYYLYTNMLGEIRYLLELIMKKTKEDLK
jgi:phage regulator Rha-like protein